LYKRVGEDGETVEMVAAGATVATIITVDWEG
jgi:hypothetical protein